VLLSFGSIFLTLVAGRLSIASFFFSILFSFFDKKHISIIQNAVLYHDRFCPGRRCRCRRPRRYVSLDTLPDKIYILYIGSRYMNPNSNSYIGIAKRDVVSNNIPANIPAMTDANGNVLPFKAQDVYVAPSN
jgi:hypothetical protein